jgi:hypothetical protein
MARVVVYQIIQPAAVSMSEVMAMNKTVEILVKAGYAEKIIGKGVQTTAEWYTEIDPFADTLEGRQQADAIEDWLVNNEIGLWIQSSNSRFVPEQKSKHQDRLDRIKWCLEQIDE